MFPFMCKVFNYGLGEKTLGIHIFKYCLGFMGTPIDLLFKPMFIVCIVIMLVKSVVESPLGAAMTVTPLS